jgi:ribonuclease Y
MEMYIIIGLSIVTFFIGGLVTWLGIRFFSKSRYDAVLTDAEKEAEVIKQKKLLEVKEKFLHLKADLEKQVSARNAKIQSVETKLKQRELSLNQNKKTYNGENGEIDVVKENLNSQLDLLKRRNRILKNFIRKR